MTKRRRDDLTLHPTGLVHARTLFEARGATPEDMDTLDHEAERIRSEARRAELLAAAWKRESSATAKAGRNQPIHGSQWRIGSAVLRSRESP